MASDVQIVDGLLSQGSKQLWSVLVCVSVEDAVELWLLVEEHGCVALDVDVLTHK